MLDIGLEKDKELIENWKDEMDNLLIFVRRDFTQRAVFLTMFSITIGWSVFRSGDSFHC